MECGQHLTFYIFYKIYILLLSFIMPAHRLKGYIFERQNEIDSKQTLN